MNSTPETWDDWIDLVNKGSHGITESAEEFRKLAEKLVKIKALVETFTASIEDTEIESMGELDEDEYIRQAMNPS